MNGRLFIIGLFLFALVLGLITYHFVPGIIIPYYMAKPGQTESYFDTVESALLRYRVDHGTFPPEEDLLLHRRPNKNVAKTLVPGTTTYHLGLLTSPIAYIRPDMPGDPYAIPEQFSPPGYNRGTFVDGAEWALVFSPGPNLKFDIRSGEVRAITERDPMEDYLRARLYDPTNGLKSGGDFYRLIVP